MQNLKSFHTYINQIKWKLVYLLINLHILSWKSLLSAPKGLSHWMTYFFAAFRIPYHSQHLHVSVYFVFERVEIWVLLSSLYLYFTLFLMCFTIKLSHRFCWVLSNTELSSELFFLFLQNLNLLFTFIHHSLLTTDLLPWLFIILLFLLRLFICLSTFLDVLDLTVHEVRVWLFHLWW